MMSLPAVVKPLAMRCSAQEMKSSNTFCLLCRDPASRQLMPYSPPPLRERHVYIRQDAHGVFVVPNAVHAPYSTMQAAPSCPCI